MTGHVGVTRIREMGDAEVYEVTYYDENNRIIGEKVIPIIMGNEPPSQNILEDVIQHLLAGVYFGRTVYQRYLPEFQPIVTLFDPTYPFEVRPEHYYIFTITEGIYEKATKKYNIKDDYRNACATWYIDMLLKKGVVPKLRDVYHLMEYRDWSCVKRLFKVLSDLDGDITFRRCIKGGNLDGIKFVLDQCDCLATVVKYANYYKHPKITEYLGPLMQLEQFDKMDEKQLDDMLKQMSEVCPIAMDKYTSTIMKYPKLTNKYVEFIKVTMSNLYAAIRQDNAHAVKMLYFKLRKITSTEHILREAARDKECYVFKAIHKVNLVKLNAIIDISCIQMLDTLQYCIQQGCVVTKEKIAKTILGKADNDTIMYLLESYPQMHEPYLSAAIKSNNLDVVKYLLSNGYSMDRSHPGLAMKNNAKEVCIWLVQQGCPINPKDLHLMPAELGLDADGVVCKR